MTWDYECMEPDHKRPRFHLPKNETTEGMCHPSRKTEDMYVDWQASDYVMDVDWQASDDMMDVDWQASDDMMDVDEE